MCGYGNPHRPYGRDGAQRGSAIGSAPSSKAMMNINRIACGVLTVALAAVAPCLAQTQGPGAFGGGPGGRMGRPPMEQSADEQLNRLTKLLTLTEDQKTKVKPILEDEKKKLSELRNGSGSQDRRAQMESFRSIHDSTMQQVRALLTTEQQDRLDKQEQEMKSRMQRGPGGGMPDDRQ